MSPQKFTAITLCSASIGILGCRDPFADCLANSVELDDGKCGIAEGSTSPTTGTTAECGNGTVESGEECDLGPTKNSNAGACTLDCKNAKCGDSNVQAGIEDCDDGNTVDDDDCDNLCFAPKCGDGVREGSLEECDDGDQDNTDDCLTSCKFASCGDGIVHSDKTKEICDNGEEKNGMYGSMCTEDCLGVGEYCGDGVLQMSNEECDDMDADDTNACLSTCKAATCGDAIIHVGVEACDDGEEENGTYGKCAGDCTGPGPRCGDGVTEPGVEQCDDGNSDDHDACRSNCEAASCGDGVVQTGAEECDDGNAVDEDDCSNMCVKPRTVFVTQGDFKGNLGGLGGADQKCSDRATSAGLPAGKWRAWLSDDNGSPSSRFDKAFAGWYRLADPDKTPVAKGLGDLPNKLALITVNEYGADVLQDPMFEPPLLVWSNTTEKGARVDDKHCNNWLSESINFDGRFGNAGAPGANWTDDTLTTKNPQACNGSAHLYCFQNF